MLTREQIKTCFKCLGNESCKYCELYDLPSSLCDNIKEVGESHFEALDEIDRLKKALEAYKVSDAAITEMIEQAYEWDIKGGCKDEN